MPRESRARPASPKPLTRKQISKREREQLLRKRLIIGTAALFGLIVLILGWGLYDQYVARPNRPVATVYGVPIRLETYQKMVKYWRWRYRNDLDYLEAQKRQFASGDESQAVLVQYIDQQIRSVQSQLINLDMATLERLIEEQITRQECARRGITVSEEEVQLKLEKDFGYDRNPPTPEPITVTLPITVTPTPTVAPMTKEQFDEQFARWSKAVNEASGLSAADIRRMVESTLLRQKLEEAIAASVPTTDEQVRARHILLETREKAEQALARLRAGEDFAKLATELSIDTGNKEDGGELGWFPRGKMVPEFEQVAFSLAPGQMSDIVETQYGFHIILVEERDPDRLLEPDALEQLQLKAVDDWFAQQRNSSEVARYWSSDLVPKETPTRSVRR